MPYKKTAITDLEKTIELARGSEGKEQKITVLMQAFEKFSLETEKIEGAYEKLEAKLTATQYYLEDILNHMSQGLLFIMANGVIKTCNPAAQKLLGLSKDSILWRDFDQTVGIPLLGFSFSERLKEKELSPIFSVIEGSKKVELEIETTLVGDQGMIILLRDITELKNLERIANRNDRMRELGAMAAVIAHEIRNPLGGIRGFASLLKRDLVGQAPMQNMVDNIIEGTEDINRLVVNILNYSSPLKVQLEWVDMVLLIKEVIKKNQASIEFNEHTNIVLDLPNSLKAYLDATLFRSILHNLVTNSIEAMPKGGNITITLYQKANEILLKVKDNGIGVAKENMEKIFTPFFTTKVRGHGFGLAYVYRIVQELHGGIMVDSELNAGTTFTITLPNREGL